MCVRIFWEIYLSCTLFYYICCLCYIFPFFCDLVLYFIYRLFDCFDNEDWMKKHRLVAWIWIHNLSLVTPKVHLEGGIWTGTQPEIKANEGLMVILINKSGRRVEIKKKN